MLTSLAPVIPSIVKNNVRNSIISTAPSIDNNITNQESMHPDKWAHKRMEGTEIEKSKVLLNLLKDVWELSTRNIIKPSHGAKLVAAIAKASANQENKPPINRSLSSSSRTVTRKLSHQNFLSRSSSSNKLKLSGHSRLNSLDVLEQYLDEENIDLEVQPRVVPPDRSQIVSLLTKVTEAEKEYVQRLAEVMSIYVNSKKRPAKAAKMFINIPPLHHFHSSVMLGTLQRCLDAYQASTDPNLDKVAKLFLSHKKELRTYVDYEMAIEESMRLIQFWKRITAIEANQPSMQYGAALPHLVSYRHPDAYIAEWIQSCAAHKGHKLSGLADYLQTPCEQLELYRYLLRKLSTITPELEAAHKMFEEICAEIEQEKPKAAEQRRMAEFDQVYNMSSLLSIRDGDSPRRYMGDAVILLKSEVRLELPSKALKADAIHYMKNEVDEASSGNSDTPEVSNDNTSEVSNQSGFTVVGVEDASKSNPVPKVLTKIVHKAKFTLPLYRVIVCDDVIILTDEDKKKVLKVLDRRQVSASLPWKYPVRDSGADALPTGDQTSLKSRCSSVASTSSTNSASGSTPVTTPTTTIISNSNSNNNNNNSTNNSSNIGASITGGGASGSLRIIFHDEPVVWYCTLRTFTGTNGLGAGHNNNYSGISSLGNFGLRGKKQKEPRVRMVELIEKKMHAVSSKS